jgi:hypothetical protein
MARRTARRWGAVASAAVVATLLAAAPADCAASEAVSIALAAAAPAPLVQEPTDCAASVTAFVALPTIPPAISADRVSGSSVLVDSRSSVMGCSCEVRRRR